MKYLWAMIPPPGKFQATMLGFLVPARQVLALHTSRQQSLPLHTEPGSNSPGAAAPPWPGPTAPPTRPIAHSPTWNCHRAPHTLWPQEELPGCPLCPESSHLLPLPGSALASQGGHLSTPGPWDPLEHPLSTAGPREQPVSLLVVYSENH